MEIGATNSAAATTPTTVAIEVQKKTEEVQEQNAATLIESVSEPAPQSGGSLGGTIDVTV